METSVQAVKYNRDVAMKKIVFILFGFLILLSGCGPLIRYDGTYNGKIIDADTGDPISGVVVLGVWYRVYPGIAGSSSHFNDARETVTDENGEFSIPGKGLSILLEFNVLIFKAGHECDYGLWESLKISNPWSTKKIRWEGDKAIIPLRKLTMEERIKRGTPPSPPFKAPFEKVKLYLKEKNKERKAQGLKPLTLWGGVRYE